MTRIFKFFCVLVTDVRVGRVFYLREYFVCSQGAGSHRLVGEGPWSTTDWRTDRFRRNEGVGV